MAHYERIQQISSFNALLIIMSMVLLMVLSVPLDEAETFRELYSWISIGVVTLVALLGGLLIAVVVMLHATIRGLVHALHPRRRQPADPQPRPWVTGDGSARVRWPHGPTRSGAGIRAGMRPTTVSGGEAVDVERNGCGARGSRRAGSGQVTRRLARPRPPGNC